MKCKLATTQSDVIQAWCTVYHGYLACSASQKNKISLFAFPHYVSNNSAVILGEKMGKTVGTISAVLDSEKGLPLDGSFKKELDKLRREGKKLLEIGLFASNLKDRNSFSNLVGLMSAAARFGMHSGHYDIVLGVHPRREQFYRSVYGCKRISGETEYDTINTGPVVLMHTNGKDLETSLLPAWQQIHNDDAGLDFSRRYLFNPNNYIPSLEFELFVDKFTRLVWNTPVLQTA